MTKDELQETTLKLPLEERIELAESLWESVEKEANALPLPDWQKRLLDERLEAAEKEPDSWLTWDEVEQRAWSSAPDRKGA